MSNGDVIVLKTQLAILIKDFQAHRKASVKQEQITELKVTLKWMITIGGFMITSMIAVLVMVL